MKDYVIAKNEKVFVVLAEKLGFTELVFINGDAQSEHSSAGPSKALGLDRVSKLKSNSGIKLSSSKRIFKSDIKKDRNLIESKKTDIIYGFETLSRKDGFHFLNSGLNHVLVKLMKEKNVSYGLSFSQLLNASRQEQAVILGRILQNLKLCKKYKVPVVVGSFANSPYQMRDSKDLLAFARTLGLQNYN